MYTSRVWNDGIAHQAHGEWRAGIEHKTDVE